MKNFPVTEKKREELYTQMKAVGIHEEDLEEKFIRSSGPGGQNANKVATCVVLKHLPTKLEVKYDKERTQGLNRFFARRKLIEAVQEQLGVKTAKQIKINKSRKQKARRKRRSNSSCEN